VVSGPSGVGKDTVLDHLFEGAQRPARLRRIVTATTRPPRENEMHAVHYWFLTEAEFTAREQGGRFLESAPFAGYRYGTPVDQIEQARQAGDDCLLKIDIQGGLAVRKTDPGAVLIFVAAPSAEDVLRRLEGRGDRDPEDLARRRSRYDLEIQAGADYDYWVVNREGRSEEAAEDIAAIVRSERLRASFRDR
jgi:guanylate kinase